MVFDFSWNFILTKLSENKVLTFFLWHFIKSALNQVNMVHVCHTYYCKKKNRRVVYLVFRAAFSCWSRFLIILHCLAVCLAVPLHQDSTIHVCNNAVCHWKKITLTKITLIYCNFFKVRTCIKTVLAVNKNKKTFLFNNLIISFLKTVHILLSNTAFYTGYVKDARVK